MRPETGRIAQRIILLFEIWRPEISEADREALTLLLEAAKISAED